MSHPKCWRGPPGAGKRRAVQTSLAARAVTLGQHYVLKRQLWDAPLQGGEDTNADAEGDAPEAEDTRSLLPMECSTLHWGFDVARMSLQDKQYVRSILARWGRGSHVTGHSRCLVFYNAHLLSSESILFLQAFLEENHRDTLVWVTSEHPLPPRLADWFEEIPLNRPGLNVINPEITEIYRAWMSQPPVLSDVKRIRAVVYALLHRNLRWTDGFHQWMFALDSVPLTPAQKVAAAAVCVAQPFTGPGQTVPSYRIPILWEQYLLSLRQALAPALVLAPAQAPPLQKGKLLTSKKVGNAAASNAAASNAAAAATRS